ncbi:MFS transporter [Paenibacillus sp. MER TA 81-3]|uniref:MFS transporter n=1 Tax=Paenibacillus sp. MER TA 81-3 TaxID=2939573 RepID=UPI00203A60DE|nr:MFS transporter [Paenibacillus sp. MER TA 81-3]MCM3337579.1 MFS transporter [Paenibacillus sp. MER TA 81-3]
MSRKEKSSGSLFILMLNMFIVMVGMGLIIPIMPKFITEFGASGQAMGYLVSAFGLTQFVFSPFAGEWSDKYGRKKMIVFGIAMFTISQFIFAAATDMWMLYASRFLGGMGAAFMTPAMMAYVADITTEDNRGKGLGWLMASMSLGVVVGPGIGGFLAESGIRIPFYAAAMIAAISTVISLLFLPETVSIEARMKSKLSQTKRENILKQFARSFKAPYFMLLVLIFTMTFGLMGFESVFGLYVDKKYDFTPKDISLMITVGALLGVVIQAVLIDKLLRRFGEKKLLIVMFVVAGVSMIIMVFVQGYFLIFAVSGLFFIATSIIRPAINTLLSKMAGNEQGFVAGMNNAYMSLGNIIGPAIAGTLFDVNINIPYVVGAVILVMSSLLLAAWSRSSSASKTAKSEAVHA